MANCTANGSWNFSDAQNATMPGYVSSWPASPLSPYTLSSIRLLPCTFFWLLFPIVSWFHGGSPRAKSRRKCAYSVVTIAKLAACGVALSTLIFEFVSYFPLSAAQSTQHALSLLTIATNLGTLVFVAMVIHHERQDGRKASVIIWFFWLLASVSGTADLHSAVLTHVLDASCFTIGTFERKLGLLDLLFKLLHYCATVAAFGLSSVADHEVNRSSLPDKRNAIFLEFGSRISPELTAGIASRLLFTWIWPIFRRGAKGTLQLADLCSLNPKDACFANSSVFERAYAAELATWSANISAKDPKKGANKRRYSTEHADQPRTTLLQNDAEAEAVPIAIELNETGLGEKMEKQAVLKEGSEFPTVLRPLLRVYWKEVLLSQVSKLVHDVMLFANIAVIGSLIRFADDPHRDHYISTGVLLSIGLFVTQVVSSVAMQHSFDVGMRCGVHMRTALSGMLYRKALSIASAVRMEATVGEIVNLMSADAQQVQDFAGYSWALWSCPLQIVVACVMVWSQMGVATLAGLATMVLLLLPTNMAVAGRQRELFSSRMQCQDQRMRAVNELVAGIRLVKLYAWEVPFGRRVEACRNRELELLRRSAFLAVFQNFIVSLTPYLVAVVTFSVFAATSEFELTAQRAFVTLSLLQTLRLPLGTLPMVIQMLVSSLVAVKRISRFLAQPELNPENVTHQQNDAHPVAIDNAYFGWSSKTVLADVNLRVHRGELLAVVGRVASGKSTLISAILGECEVFGGQVNVSGSLAYVSQQSWLQNASLRDNVLFGSAFDAEKYTRVLSACALEPDLSALPAGDLTPIGEKGVTLSGGQKQRVALARALYADAEIYLLDDPLSAVDVHVGRHIFDRVIGPSGLLAGKTRIFVTNGLHWLRECDRVAVIDHNERRIEQLGRYDELVSAEHSFLYAQSQIGRDADADDSLSKCNDGGKAGETITPEIEIAVEVKREEEGDEQNLLLEKCETGRVGANVYLSYLRAQSFRIFLVYVTSLTAVNGLYVLSNWWVSLWTADQRLLHDCAVSPMIGNESCSASITERNALRNHYLVVFVVIGLSIASASLVAAVLNAIGSVRASRKLHATMLDRVLHAPLRFFDSTPTGRILNRFSRDVGQIDNVLPFTIRGWLQTVLSTIFTFIGVTLGTAYAIILIIPVGLLSYIVQHFYVPSSRQLQRLNSTSRSPVFSHFSESLQGCSTIRAFSASARFIAEAERRLDRDNVLCVLGFVSNCWVATHLDLISAFFSTGSAAFCIAFATTGAQVGLSLTYTLSIAQSLNWLVRMSCEIETDVVSLERVQEYSELEQEAKWLINSPDSVNCGVQSAANWPENGGVRFDRFATRYGGKFDLVLREISLQVQPASKIGIVGRSGAGKSSLALALFRMIEAEEGSIEIDGVDISKLGLHQLRGAITILPQEPVLFAGSLRENLDPFCKYPDEEIWRALDLSNLRDYFAASGQGLEFECSEGGANLSVGQRQLVCLARALLRNSKLLILDEATAAVDYRTDEFIQRTIRTAFAGSTVITIAHRINSVLDYDRILVLDRGRVIEFDSPAALLAQPNSVFAAMVRESN